MAIVKVIEIKATTKDAEKDLKDLNEQLEIQRSVLTDLEKQLIEVEKQQQKTNKTNLAAQKILADKAANIKNELKLEKIGLRELNAEKRNASLATKDLTNDELNSSKVIKFLDKLTGGLATTFKKVYEGSIESAKGIMSFVGGLSNMKKALLATGIGALVVALGVIVSYWDEINEFINGGNKKLETQQGKINEQIQTQGVQLDLLKQQLAIEELKNGESPKLTAEYRKQLVIQREQNLALLENLQTQLELEESKNKEVSFWEKTKILAAGLISPSLQAAEIGKSLNKNSERSIELTNKINEAKKKTGTIDLELAQLDDKEKKKKEEAAKKADEAAKKAKAKRDKELEDEFNNLQKINAIREKFRLQNEDAEDITEFEKLNRKYERDLLELERLGATEQQKLDLETYYNSLRQTQYIESEDYLEQLEIEAEDERLKRLGDDALKEISISKSISIAKEQIRQAEINNLERGFQLLGQVAGKNKVLQAAALIGESAIGIAKIVINTQAANAAARLKYALIPGGLALAAAEISANKVGAGIGIAANIAATAKGLSSLKASGSVPTAGGNSLSGGTGGGVSQPASFNVVGASNTNQLADAIGGQAQQPIKAFVVSNDVTTAQSMDRNIVNGASI
jgi:hypothetical protein